MKNPREVRVLTDPVARKLSSAASVLRFIGILILIIGIFCGFIPFSVFGKNHADLAMVPAFSIWGGAILGYVIFSVCIALTFDFKAALLNHTMRTERLTELLVSQLPPKAQEPLYQEVEKYLRRLEWEDHYDEGGKEETRVEEQLPAEQKADVGSYSKAEYCPKCGARKNASSQRFCPLCGFSYEK